RGRSYLRMTLRNRTLVETLSARALGTDGAATAPETETKPEHSGASAPAESEPTEQTKESE
ncbi:MAG: hypothetical protein ACRDG7_09830, partial [Candidatus Limnocylindria bacterium]